MNATNSLKHYAREKLAGLEAAGQQRSLIATDRLAHGRARRGGVDLISFCDNDYLSLSHDPRLVEAAVKAAYAHGTGAGASRLVTGNLSLNAALESRLAKMKGLESARVFGSGYLANIGTIPTLVGRGDTVIMDELSHACMHAGARLSGAAIKTFGHNDSEHAAQLMEEAQGQVLLLTETVFSMDGDLAPLDELAEICNAHDAWLMTDDAHGFGVCTMDNPAPIQMGTLSKAAGGYGGPAGLAAAIAALDVMKAEPERAECALANVTLFAGLMGLPAPRSVIVPFIIGAESEAMRVSADLQAAGFLVTAIWPPTVPAGTARLRFTFSAGHKPEDVRAVSHALKECMAIV